MLAAQSPRLIPKRRGRLVDEHDQLGFLAEQLLQCSLTPEILPIVADSLVAWLGGEGNNDRPSAHRPASDARSPPGPGCQPKQPATRPEMPEDSYAIAAAAGEQSNCRRMVELLIRCRALNELSAHAINSAHCSHVAAIVLTRSGRVLDCDRRGSAFLRAGDVLRLVDGQLNCSDGAAQARFGSAFKDTAEAGRTTNLLLHGAGTPAQRFCLTFTRTLRRQSAAKGPADNFADVLCLAASLDGRRIATARQLMDLFGLSAAEARLARSICHGDSVEDYARDQGLRLPTIRTQLSSIFNKTGCRRQSALVRLISSIPVVRDPA